MTPQEKRIDKFLAAVHADCTREQALTEMVKEFVPGGTDKSKQEAERDIAQKLFRTPVFRRTLTGTGPRTRQGASRSLDKLRQDLEKLATKLDGGTVWPPPRKGVIEPYVARVLSNVGVDAQKEADHLRALAAAAQEAKLELPHLKGGRPYDEIGRWLAPVCVQLAEKYRKLVDDKTEDLKMVHSLFTYLHLVATGEEPPKRGPDGQPGIQACNQALEQWCAQAASGQKEGEHAP